MDISSLIQLMQNKESTLSNAKSQAFSIGDLNQMNLVEKELLETQNTLAQLRLLAQLEHAAQSTNSTTSAIVASGVDALQNAPVSSPDSIINGYDIGTYAVDPLHEQKIRNLLAAMPVFTTAEDITSYIQNAAPGSPVTGQMVIAAATAYAVDIALVMAIMQNDSNFGTLGVGARTNNPGNVGNNGVEERRYGSWEEGVAAVAQWLSVHRVLPPERVVIDATVPPPEPAPNPSIEPTPPTEPSPVTPPSLEPPQNLSSTSPTTTPEFIASSSPSSDTATSTESGP